MNIYISIDGVLRNLIEKFKYHYVDYYLQSITEELTENAVYEIKEPIFNKDLTNHFVFESIDEYNNFLYIEYALEIFGYSNTSYQQVFNDLNNFFHQNKNNNVYVVGLDELGKSKPATLFFLSKNGFLGDNIKFISTKDIDNEWKKTDVWITDNENIINKCPKNKVAIKFNTSYNNSFTHKKEINKLTEIDKLWLKFLEKNTLSIFTTLVNRVKLVTLPLMKMVMKLVR